MAVGAVSFHKDKMVSLFCDLLSRMYASHHLSKQVKRIHVPTKDNAIVNRINKTRKEIEVDHEADQIRRQKEEARVKSAAAKQAKSQAEEARKAWMKDKEERSYDRLFTEEALEEAKANENKSDDEDFFM